MIRNRSLLDTIFFNIHLDGSILCLHSSFSKVKHVFINPDNLIDYFLGKGCTLVTPAHHYQRRVRYKPSMNILQNGIDSDNESHQSMDRIYTPENTEISSEMGIVAKHILLRKESFIGYHPENAFASLGPEAEAIIQSQSPWNVYAPYDRIMTYDKAFILLLGVDLCKATPIHYAEYVSGRIPFIRWYCDENHVIRPMRVGGCSDGFDSCSSVVSHLNQCKPGNSGWINIYPFKDFIHELVQIFRQNHEITRCSDPECPRCRDILKGVRFTHLKGMVNDWYF